MRLEHAKQEKLKNDIKKIIGKYLDLKKYRVFFFGSRVSGNSHSRSDIDVGIEGPRPLPLGIMEEIKDEIDDLPVLYSIDVVDFKEAAPDFRKVARKDVERI